MELKQDIGVAAVEQLDVTADDATQVLDKLIDKTGVKRIRL